MSKYKVGDKVKINTNKMKQRASWYTVDPDDVFEIIYVAQYCDGLYQIAAHINEDFRIVPDAEPQFERVTIQSKRLTIQDALLIPAEPKTDREDIEEML